jgi:Transglycosylase-like domain
MHSRYLLRRTRYSRSTPDDAAVAKPRRRALARSAVIAAAVVSMLGLTFTVADRASADLPTGAGMVLNAPIVGAAATPDGTGYWLVGADGGVFSFGSAAFYGSTGSIHLNQPIVGIESTPDGHGYWEVGGDGGVFAFGDASFHGSTGGIRLGQPMVGIESTPDGGGYWMVASDGGVFAFGDAHFYGSATGLSPTSPIVGLAPTPDGGGYWEAAANGDVYSFGDAAYGGGADSGQPVVGISALGPGYRLVSADGGIFDFGGAHFYGSTGGMRLNKPMIGMSPTEGGYITVASDGGIFTFGAAGFYGSLAGSTVYSPPSAALGVGADGVTNFQRVAWFRVNMCEEGGLWNVDGPIYSGGLGFSHANWDTFNTFGYPSDAARATPEQQIRVAVAFAVRYWGNPNVAPDQHGCSGGY